MQPLPYPDDRRLEAVQGWLMLGDVASARAELEEMSAVSRGRPEVLELEWSLHSTALQWQAAFDVAQRLIEVAPDRPFGWIHRAYALRRMPGGGLAQAWAALRPAHDRFPRQFLIPYNLACYAAQMGKTDEAWDWLQCAIDIGGRSLIKRMALADTDLELLWPRLAETSGC